MADLVVLDANPLIAIANTTRIQAVMRRGHLIEAAALRSMLDGVRAEVGRMQLKRDLWRPPDRFIDVCKHESSQAGN